MIIKKDKLIKNQLIMRVILMYDTIIDRKFSLSLVNSANFKIKNNNNKEKIKMYMISIVLLIVANSSCINVGINIIEHIKRNISIRMNF